ncbi:hypothetical protein BDR26DRAFT_852511 [Obelidium mucronatum]|nr:hypothetical protein BDR26DRAFT_852511 [Obelidium mucronatum]
MTNIISILALIASVCAIPMNHPRQAGAQSASDITVPYNAPILPNAAAVPTGSYVCNANKLYQSTYQANRQIGWSLLDTCAPGTYCTVKIGTYIGCGVSPP